MKVTLFSQIISLLQRDSFRNIVRQKGTDKHSKGIDSWTHLVSMLFCQFSKSNSLREISNGLRSATGNLSHLAVSRAPCKSSLSYQNARRDWTLFRDYFFKLSEYMASGVKNGKKKFRIKSKIYLLDSTTISLCLSLFDWALYRKRKGAIKLHTLLDYDGCLPVFAHLTDGKVHDAKIAQGLDFPKGSVTVMDRAYLDFANLYRMQNTSAYFVVRLKSSIQYQTIGHVQEIKDKHKNSILVDEYILLSHQNTYDKYPDKLRLVVAYDPKTNQTIEVITNHFSWTASTIAQLYKQRWQIEIFFKELKQHLKIKSFVGTSQNAVLIQIWTALITILILKYLKYIAKHNWHLSNLVAFLRLNLFVKIDLKKWLNRPFEDDVGPNIHPNQQLLFDL